MAGGSRTGELFGRNLERFRRALGWERSDAAKQFGCSTSHEFLMEKGGKGASFDLLDRISEATMIPVWKFFYEEGENEKL